MVFNIIVDFANTVCFGKIEYFYIDAFNDKFMSICGFDIENAIFSLRTLCNDYNTNPEINLDSLHISW